MAKSKLSDEDKKVLDRWKTEICDKAKEVDPDEQFIWHGVWVGFAVGCGMPLDKATNYSFYMDHAFPLECGS